MSAHLWIMLHTPSGFIEVGHEHWARWFYNVAGALDASWPFLCTGARVTVWKPHPARIFALEHTCCDTATGRLGGLTTWCHWTWALSVHGLVALCDAWPIHADGARFLQHTLPHYNSVNAPNVPDARTDS